MTVERATKADAVKLAASLGATIEVDEGSATILRAIVPDGSVWNATGAHTINVAIYTDRPYGWACLIQDMRAGIEVCPDGDGCEWCTDSPNPHG